MPRQSICFLMLFVAGTVLASDDDFLRCRQITDTGQRLSCYDAIVVTPAAKSPPAASKPRQDAEAFGEVRPTDEGVQSIESSVEGDLNGWQKNDKIRLVNGQVWRVADDIPVVARFKNPKVTIRRGLLGAYYLEIEGSHRSARVKRVQ